MEGKIIERMILPYYSFLYILPILFLSIVGLPLRKEEKNRENGSDLAEL